MNDNHNCELFMNMKQDMNRDLCLVRYMPLGVEELMIMMMMMMTCTDTSNSDLTKDTHM